MNIKNLMLVMIFLFSTTSQAQQNLKVIEASTDKFVSIQFPSNIDMFQNSVSIVDDIGIKSVDDILFIQFMSEENIPETNLFVKTIDNKTYQFLLRYNDNPKDLHIVIGNEGVNNDTSVKQSLVADYSNVAFKVAKEKGYIRSRNFTSYKKINLYLKGIYVYQNRIYFLMNIVNNTDLSYDINSFKFFITNKGGIANSEQILDINILEKFPQTTQLKKGSYDIVFAMNKFTVGSDKKLLFEMTEQNGDRNLSMEITSSWLDKARPINNF